MSLPLDISSYPKDSSLGSLEQQLLCPICLEIFSKPVVILPCLHNLCRKCANELYQVGIGGRFRCPSCRREVLLDRHGVYGLQRNLLVENIIDAYKLESASSKPPPKPLAEVNCADHPDEKLNIYCLTCQTPTCSLCKVFGAHNHCQVVPLPEVYQQQKTELNGEVAALVSTNFRMQRFIDELNAVCRNIEENSKQQKHILCEKFDSMSAILEERRKEMTQQITSEQEEKTGWAQSLLQNYSKHVETNSKLIETARNAIEEPEMAAFVQVSKDLIERVANASDCVTLESLEFNYEKMDHYRVNFSAEEKVLHQLDFMEYDEEEEEEEEDEEAPESDRESELEPEPPSTPEHPLEDQDLKSESFQTRNPEEEMVKDNSDMRRTTMVFEKNGLSTSQTVTLILFSLAFLVLLQRIYGSVQFLYLI